MHTRRHVSGPTLELLEKAKLAPAEVDEAIEQLVQSGSGALLRARYPLIERIAHATGFNVTQICRRSRYLLIMIEQFDDQGAYWQYREHTPRNCVFSCRGIVADDLALSLAGKLLETLACPTAGLARSRIIDVNFDDDSWLDVRVSPDWHLF